MGVPEAPAMAGLGQRAAILLHRPPTFGVIQMHEFSFGQMDVEMIARKSQLYEHPPFEALGTSAVRGCGVEPWGRS